MLCLAQGKGLCWVIAADYPQLWSGDCMGYLFTSKEMKLFPFNCFDYWPPFLDSSNRMKCFLLLKWLSLLWPKPIGLKKKKRSSERGNKKKVCITRSVEEGSCFLLRLHKWLAFCAEVLMQLDVLVLQRAPHRAWVTKSQRNTISVQFCRTCASFHLLYLIVVLFQTPCGLLCDDSNKYIKKITFSATTCWETNVWNLNISQVYP